MGKTLAHTHCTLLFPLGQPLVLKSEGDIYKELTSSNFEATFQCNLIILHHV